jgi:hypothetical protein
MTPEEQLIQRYFDVFNRHDLEDARISGRDPIQLILLVVVVLFLIGLSVSLFAPLGNYWLWSL